jgi:hypothetical protein
VNKKKQKNFVSPLEQRPVPQVRDAEPKFFGYRVPMIERPLASEI